MSKTKKIRSFVVRIFLNTTYCGQNVISHIYVKPQLDHKKNTWCWKVFSSVCKCRNELYLFHVQSTDYAQALPRTHNTNTARAARGTNVKGGDMLTGQYQRSLDSKIRVTLPAPQRKQLGDVVILLRRQDALYGYSPEAYEAWIASLNLNPRNRDDVTALRMLNAAATTVDIDSAGRVALGKIDESDPQAREKLQLDRDVTIVGNGDHFEIWNTNKWNSLFSADDRVATLEDLIFGA